VDEIPDYPCKGIGLIVMDHVSRAWHYRGNRAGDRFPVFSIVPLEWTFTAVDTQGGAGDAGPEGARLLQVKRQGGSGSVKGVEFPYISVVPLPACSVAGQVEREVPGETGVVGTEPCRGILP
jgi:hypothetical protein